MNALRSFLVNCFILTFVRRSNTVECIRSIISFMDHTNKYISSFVSIMYITVTTTVLRYARANVVPIDQYSLLSPVISLFSVLESQWWLGVVAANGGWCQVENGDFVSLVV